jgi:hypothetical protein
MEEAGRLMFWRDSVSSGENMQQSDDVDIACRSGDDMDGFRNCTINGIIIIMCVRPCISSAIDYLKRPQKHTGLCVDIYNSVSKHTEWVHRKQYRKCPAWRRVFRCCLVYHSNSPKKAQQP